MDNERNKRLSGKIRTVWWKHMENNAISFNMENTTGDTTESIPVANAPSNDVEKKTKKTLQSKCK
jgi:hypothetical protein